MTRWQGDHQPPPFAGGDGLKVTRQILDVLVNHELPARIQLARTI